jgi:hypothetical protein
VIAESVGNRGLLVFVSFDFDNDKTLKDFIIGQASHSDSPFEVSDYSLKEPAPEADWESKAHAAISRADKFLGCTGCREVARPELIDSIHLYRDSINPEKLCKTTETD